MVDGKPRTFNALTVMAVGLLIAMTASAAEFAGDWSNTPDRMWIGEHYWANRLHDWRVNDGRLECVAGPQRLPYRTAHLLTHRVGKEVGAFEMTVKTGVMDNGQELMPGSFTGFLIGAGGPETDYRSASLIHHAPGNGGGIIAGVSSSGLAEIRDFTTNEVKAIGKRGLHDPVEGGMVDVELRLKVEKHETADTFRVSISVHDIESGQRRIEAMTGYFLAERLAGNVGLISHPGDANTARTRHWFKDWTVKGDKIIEDKSAALGPIIACQHTLTRKGDKALLKLTAQLPPIGEKDPQTAELQIKQGEDWKTIAVTDIVTPGYTAPFRIEDWDDTQDTPYRVRYEDATFEGVIRRNPVDKNEIVLAGFTGNHMVAHGFGRPGYDYTTNIWFPHTQVVKNVSFHRPDVLFFSGDQVYEGASPTFADTSSVDALMHDYLYKWYLWCWSYRDLMRDTPTVTIPDDHDVYQGNIWGQGGRKSPGRDHHGGYVHPAAFVKMVERTQTSHLPDPFDPTPVEQGIGVYYTDMTYGRISFAIIEDRKFKSGCARDDIPPSGTGRPDHFNDPNFDISELDIPDVTLLGDRQLVFLEHWAGDWRQSDMKCALSQTIFANMATHHGGNLQRLIADLDSNGWPQTGRRKAIEKLRKAHAVHVAGDQHLATVVEHGIDEQGDAIWSFCVPSVANFYPRAWAPTIGEPYRVPEDNEYKGQFRDGFGNLVSVHAATNPGQDMGHDPRRLHNGMPGYGITRFNKKDRTYTFECWPRFADPATDQPYKDWPITITQIDNGGRTPIGWLPTIDVKGTEQPVIQAIHEKTGEMIYTLRLTTPHITAPVFTEGTYTLIVSQPDDGRTVTLKGITPTKTRGERTEVVDLN